VAVDAAGNLYVNDTGNGRVLKLPAGSSTQTVLPFTGLKSESPWGESALGVAVDAAGNVYLMKGRQGGVVLKLPAGSATQMVLFTGVHVPSGVAVDSRGNVYIADLGNHRVVKLPVQ
jgi:serine/threonine protein kinase, bacterial